MHLPIRDGALRKRRESPAQVAQVGLALAHLGQVWIDHAADTPAHSCQATLRLCRTIVKAFEIRWQSLSAHTVAVARRPVLALAVPPALEGDKLQNSGVEPAEDGAGPMLAESATGQHSVLIPDVCVHSVPVLDLLLVLDIRAVLDPAHVLDAPKSCLSS